MPHQSDTVPGEIDTMQTTSTTPIADVADDVACIVTHIACIVCVYFIESDQSVLVSRCFGIIFTDCCNYSKEDYISLGGKDWWVDLYFQKLSKHHCWTNHVRCLHELTPSLFRRKAFWEFMYIMYMVYGICTAKIGLFYGKIVRSTTS